MTSTPNQYAASILVVDDTPDNLHLLAGFLKDMGYTPRLVPNGELALRAAQSEPPDLILLDILMPGLNGFEVCERLKADPDLHDIPVIFLSALTETLDKVKAFAAGGVDYITKPIEYAEVLARVETHLELRRKKRQLQESLESLKNSEELRQGMVQMIVQDLNAPLAVITENLAELKNLGNERLTIPGVRWVDQAMTATTAISEMVDSMLEVRKLQSGRINLDLSAYDIAVLIRDSLIPIDALRGQRRVQFDIPNEPAIVWADASLLKRVIQNLVGNAFKHTQRDSFVQIRVEQTKDFVKVFVQDDGPGIAEVVRDKFFHSEKASIFREPATGLGLPFCRFAVEAHGGRIGVENEPGLGCTFWFELPRDPEAIHSTTSQ